MKRCTWNSYLDTQTKNDQRYANKRQTYMGSLRLHVKVCKILNVHLVIGFRIIKS